MAGESAMRTVAIREKLPMRRASETVRFDHSGISYRATIGYYADGRIGEIFLDADKSTSDADRIGKEAAILLSLAAQHGCPIETIRKAMPRNVRGEPEGPLGKLMDLLGEQSK